MISLGCENQGNFSWITIHMWWISWWYDFHGHFHG